MNSLSALTFDSFFMFLFCLFFVIFMNSHSACSSFMFILFYFFVSKMRKRELFLLLVVY